MLSLKPRLPTRALLRISAASLATGLVALAGDALADPMSAQPKLLNSRAAKPTQAGRPQNQLPSFRQRPDILNIRDRLTETDTQTSGEPVTQQTNAIVCLAGCDGPRGGVVFKPQLVAAVAPVPASNGITTVSAPVDLTTPATPAAPAELTLATLATGSGDVVCLAGCYGGQAKSSRASAGDGAAIAGAMPSLTVAVLPQEPQLTPAPQASLQQSALHVSLDRPVKAHKSLARKQQHVSITKKFDRRSQAKRKQIARNAHQARQQRAALVAIAKVRKAGRLQQPSRPQERASATITTSHRQPVRKPDVAGVQVVSRDDWLARLQHQQP